MHCPPLPPFHGPFNCQVTYRGSNQKPGGSRQSNWVFSRVSVITNGNKAPGGFNQPREGRLLRGNPAEKSGAAGAFRGFVFLKPCCPRPDMPKE
jgi:hypothetical protein